MKLPLNEKDTAWPILACFAMYKLFNEWYVGHIGMCRSEFDEVLGLPIVQDATVSQSKDSLV